VVEALKLKVTPLENAQDSSAIYRFEKLTVERVIFGGNSQVLLYSTSAPKPHLQVTILILLLSRLWMSNAGA
jgi:hypothetical protein